METLENVSEERWKERWKNNMEIRHRMDELVNDAFLDEMQKQAQLQREATHAQQDTGVEAERAELPVNQHITSNP